MSIGRNLPFPFLQRVKTYARQVQTAYGPRLYFIRCVPKPEVTEMKAVITSKTQKDSIYVYAMLCDDGHTRTYETVSGRFEATEHVIITIKGDVILAMRKESENKIVAIIADRPRFLATR